jgi:glycosyltransferase involved in cell wall biosynthesis
MKYVFVSYNYSPDIDSPEKWLDRIEIYRGALECLSKENEVIRIDQINYKGIFSHKGVQYYFVKNANKKLHFPRRLNRLVKDLKPDTVIVAGLHYPLETIQLRMQLGKKIKIIAQNHAEKPFTGIKKFLQKIADRCIDGYFFSSKAMGAEWVRKGSVASLQKIHEVMEVSSVFNPVDKDLAKSKTRVTGNPVFLWVGRLNNNKDPLTVIKAFLQFSKQQSSARLYMIFHTSELLVGVRNLLEQNKSSEEVIVLVGKVDHNDMLYWLNSADFIVSGSHYEGSGTAVCEAMSCGCIPILTDIFSFQMISDDGNCGLLYEAGNVQALTSALIKTTKMNLAEERNKALEQFRKKLSFEAIAHAIQETTYSL